MSGPPSRGASSTTGTLATLADSTPPLDGAPLYVLRVTGGPDDGASLVLDWSTMMSATVGHSRVCDLPLSDRHVSRRHLTLAPDGARIRITDLGTRNGTKIGGVSVHEAFLTGGENLEIGHTRLRLVRVGSAPRTPHASRDRFGRVLGISPPMVRLFSLAERFAGADVPGSAPLPILVEGATGTGKALLTEAIHETSPRAARPFLVYEAAALEGHAELDQLFGAGDRPGLLELASGGTLVLDEVGELDDITQARLVSVLERGVVQRKGAGRRIDVRILSTSRRGLEAQVLDGTFREELLFRLAGARLEMPKLAERPEDIELLANHFWTLSGAERELPRSFLMQLQRQDFPGNVRELEHAIARRVALGDAFENEPFARAPVGADLFDQVLGMDLAMSHARQIIVDEFEQRYVTHALAAHGGNVSRAAAASGLTRRYFHMLRAKQKR